MNRGDVVVLKSGGPQMTVRAMYPEGHAGCVWFDRQGEEIRSSFHKDLLLKCPKPGTVVPAPGCGSLIGAAAGCVTGPDGVPRETSR